MMLAAVHLAMNQWFDMDEMFKCLVEGEANYVCIEPRPFAKFVANCVVARRQFSGHFPKILDNRDRSSSRSTILPL